MLKKTGYPVLAPSRVKAEGGKYRLLEGHPVSISRFERVARFPSSLCVLTYVNLGLGAYGEHHGD